jgi:hypothetical protein
MSKNIILTLAEALAGFLESQFCSSFHDQMPQGVAAVDECRTVSIAHDPNVGPRIDSPALDLLHVLRQGEPLRTLALA